MSIIDRIKSFFVSKDHIKQYNRQLELQLKYFVRAEHLKECIYKCKEMGVSNEKYCEHEVIVSLTTFGKRLYDVATTIESIMQGSKLPNRIILWLSEDEFKDADLPLSLQLQQQRGLQIEYCKDIRSYKKLIPSLKKFPNSLIVTIDDDLLYESDLVENLLRSYKKHPHSISASRMHKIVLNDTGLPVNYVDWNWCVNPCDCSPLYFPTTGGGTLFPPKSLDEEVFNEEVFLNICKYADDIWFYAMAKKKGTDIVKSYTHSTKGEDYVINLDVQDVGLHNINYTTENRNDIQFKAVFDYYNLYSVLIKHD